jgi:hypothetical protein
MGGANGSRECAPDDKLRDTHHIVGSDSDLYTSKSFSLLQSGAATITKVNQRI